jgi:hypothetical protein
MILSTQSLIILLLSLDEDGIVSKKIFQAVGLKVLFVGKLFFEPNSFNSEIRFSFCNISVLKIFAHSSKSYFIIWSSFIMEIFLINI